MNADNAKQERTWLEKLDALLVDEFHHGLFRIITESRWQSEVMVGALEDPLDFFACLDNLTKFVIENHDKPERLRSYFASLNLSGKSLVNGLEKDFLSSRVPCDRQNTLLFHSLRLVLENRFKGVINLELIVPIIRREAHQCIRLVLLHMRLGSHSKLLRSVIAEMETYEWQTMANIQKSLFENFSLWLQDEGVDSGEVDSIVKIHRFCQTLSLHMHYRPGQTEPVDFSYAHLFTEWQKYSFCMAMSYEISRFESLINLERLSHRRIGDIKGDLAPPVSYPSVNESTVQPIRGGTQYQRLLAIHYLLRLVKAKDINAKKSKFFEFLTGFSAEKARQAWSNLIPSYKVRETSWEDDMKLVRRYFEELGITEGVHLVDRELKVNGD